MDVRETVVSVLVTARATRADTTIGGSADGIVAIGIEPNPRAYIPEVAVEVSGGVGEDRVDREFWKKIVELKKHGNERRGCKEAEDGQ